MRLQKKKKTRFLVELMGGCGVAVYRFSARQDLSLLLTPFSPMLPILSKAVGFRYAIWCC